MRILLFITELFLKKFPETKTFVLLITESLKPKGVTRACRLELQDREKACSSRSARSSSLS